MEALKNLIAEYKNYCVENDLPLIAPDEQLAEQVMNESHREYLTDLLYRIDRV